MNDQMAYYQGKLAYEIDAWDVSEAMKRQDKLVVVGNSDNDILAAKKYGATSILFNPVENKRPIADYHVKTLEGVPEIIESLEFS